MRFLTIYDFILPIAYIVLIIIIANIIKNRNIKENEVYKYFIWGLMAKIIGGIGVVLIYCFYYVGGDTIAYFEQIEMLNKIALRSFSTYLSVISGNLSNENLSIFIANAGWPMYWKDPQSFSVIRFSSLMGWIGANSFIPTTIIVATMTYTGIWRMFLLMVEQFKEIKKNIAIAILFMPSVFFWGSAILKDSYTLCAACWFVVSIYYILIKKRKVTFHVIALLLSIYILISLKPYIFFACAAATTLMVAHYYLKTTTNVVLKYTVMPFLVVSVIIAGTYSITQMGSTIGGEYSSVDAMLNKIAVMQQDLIQDYYGGNTFDIGRFEPTIPGVLSKAPAAIIAGTFRPFLWECRNPIMMISGIENTVILFLFLYVILLSVTAAFKIGLGYMWKTTFDNSLVIFSLVFAFSFAFFVGISTANFGALVRYKIPLIPFLMASLFIIIRKYNREKEEDIAKRKAEKEANEAKRNTPSPRKPGGFVFPYKS
ncbi:TPA: hypothetical protein ENS27_00470 [bacterium]|nr:hypothetical protein [bacterium]